ncbi:hypothetical protein BJ165DRAFT_1002341 [Panaeolus papilionaceus]|nr:hypothetical protein BJ165DRAFT_1002341 [Panaeolus papilionaceus]
MICNSLKYGQCGGYAYTGSKQCAPGSKCVDLGVVSTRYPSAAMRAKANTDFIYPSIIPNARPIRIILLRQLLTPSPAAISEYIKCSCLIEVSQMIRQCDETGKKDDLRSIP